MTDTVETPNAPASRPPRRKGRKRRMLRVGIKLVILAVVLAMAMAAGAFYLAKKPVVAPAWLQARIEARIAQELPDARVTFGAMAFVAGEGLAPHVRLRDVTVRTATGSEIVSFNEFNATVSGASLLQGLVQPREITLSGVVATLRRGSRGRVALRAGRGAVSREAATLPQLIGQLDGVLSTRSLSALETVNLRALTLQFIDARADRTWTVDGGRLRLDRKGDDLALSADLAVLSGGAGVATLAANYASKIGETAADFGVSFDGVAAADIAAQSAAFAWLDVLRAPIAGSVRSGLLPDGRFAPLNATLQIGAGVVQPTEGTKPIPFNGARSYFSFDPQEQLLRFDELSVDSKWVSGTANGTAMLGGVGENAAFSDLVGQFELRDLQANPDDVYPEAVSIDMAEVDFQLKLNPFRVRLGRLQINDQGKTLLVDGDLQAGNDGWRVALDAQMDSADPKRVLELWPTSLKTRTRRWLNANLLDAEVMNIDAALRIAPETKRKTYVGFDYANASVQYLRSMPPVVDGHGHFSLTDDRLVVTLDKGDVVAPQGGKVAVGGSSFILPDVRVRGGTPAIIRVSTDAPAEALLSVLNQPPLRLMDRARLPVDLAQGRAVLQGTLALPLARGTNLGDVTYHVAGDLLDVSTSALVRGRTLSARKVALLVDNAGLSITGQGAIDGIGFDGQWRQPIGAGSDKSRARGQLAITQKALDTFGIPLPKGMLTGTGSANVTLDLARGAAPRFALNSNLRGLTLRVPEVSWVKPAGNTGSLKITGRLGGQPTVDTLEVSAKGLDAVGNVTLKPGGALDRLRFSRLRVNGWLDIPLDLVGRGAGKSPQLVLRGGTLDMRRAEFGSGSSSGGGGNGGGGGGAPSPPVKVNLDRLQITDSIALTGLSGTFATTGGLAGDFVASLNGGTPVQGRVSPQGGRSAVRLTSNDAGGVVRSAGLLKQIVGGKLTLTLLPVGSGGAFDGRVKATDVRVKDAPGIAGLLNAVSLVGLVNEMNGDGIRFNEVEGDFRLTPNRLTLTQASATGASMGLSMDGVYGLNNGQIAMQGVITPVYLLNGVGSLLTRKGEGLFGFNYKLRGPAADPKVSVNALSALAPGLLRDVLRGKRAELPEVDGVTESTLPEVKPPPRKKPVVDPVEWR